MKILRAKHLGMCFGVRDAITLAMEESEHSALTILGELAHNESVLASLQARGIAIESDLRSVNTPALMITAHGASERALERARQTGRRVLEGTCPLVRHAHRMVGQLVRTGHHPVIIGVRHHVEVRGLTEDLEAFDVVLNDSDVERLEPRPRFGVAAQTTQPVDRVRRLLGLIRSRFPESAVRFIDTVCQPTKDRQTAAMELARQCDVVVVIGGAHSNNTRELAVTCAQFCPRVHPVQTAADLRAEWFLNAEIVGLTAGTSTPDDVVDEVESALLSLAQTLPASSGGVLS